MEALDIALALRLVHRGGCNLNKNECETESAIQRKRLFAAHATQYQLCGPFGQSNRNQTSHVQLGRRPNGAVRAVITRVLRNRINETARRLIEATEGSETDRLKLPIFTPNVICIF